MNAINDEDPVGRRVAAAIRDARQRSGLAVADVVERMHEIGWPVSESSLMRLERHDRRCEVGELDALTGIFGVDPGHLLQGSVTATTSTPPAAPAAGEQGDNLGWAIVEQLGHRRLAGRIAEVKLAGVGFLRLDVPETPGRPARTQFLAPGSLFALHPVDEATARAAAAASTPDPVQRWEMPALPAGRDDADEDGGPW